MSRFDVRRGVRGIPYYLEVQSEAHDHLATKVVIPMIEMSRIENPTRGLHLRLEVEEKSYYLVTPMIAAVPAHTLGKVVANLESHSYDITAAIDFLLQGF